MTKRCRDGFAIDASRPNSRSAEALGPPNSFPRSVRSSAPARNDAACGIRGVHAPVYVMRQAGSSNRFSSCSATSAFKQRNATSAASSGSEMRSTTKSVLSQRPRSHNSPRWPTSRSPTPTTFLEQYLGRMAARCSRQDLCCQIRREADRAALAFGSSWRRPSC